MQPYDLTFPEKQILLAKRQKKLRENATESELIFKARLDFLKIRYIFQKGFIAGKNFCIVDFYLLRPYKVAIEIDGSYHNTIEQQKRDANKQWYLTKRKIRVIRIKNEDVATIDILELIQKKSGNRKT